MPTKVPTTTKTAYCAPETALPTGEPEPDIFLLSRDRVLPPRTTAAVLGVSTITLLRKRKLADAGGLPFVRLSAGRIGYRVADIRAFLDASRVGALPIAA